MKQGEVIDRIGAIDQEIEALLAERERLARRLEGKVGVREGLEFRANGYYKRNTWLDPRKVKRRLGVEETAKCYSSSESFCLRVTSVN